MGSEARAVSLANGWHIYVMGFIRYSDWDSEERYMGFCREYFPQNVLAEGSFRHVDNSDYEYED
jgi:hypothetical protein